MARFYFQVSFGRVLEKEPTRVMLGATVDLSMWGLRESLGHWEVILEDS